MSATPRILALAGSTRKDSYNKRLVRIAARGAQEAGAEVDVIDLRDFPLPLFDQDLEREEGTPEAATRLKGLMVEHDAFFDLIARVQQLNQRRPEERYRLGESPGAR